LQNRGSFDKINEEGIMDIIGAAIVLVVVVIALFVLAK